MPGITFITSILGINTDPVGPTLRNKTYMLLSII